MRRLIAFTPHMLVTPRNRAIFLALIACAASLAPQAQTASAILPADPAPAAGASIAAPISGNLATRFNASAQDFNQSRIQPFAAPAGSDENSPQWNRKMLEPFQPGPNFGNFSRSTDSSNRSDGAGLSGNPNRFGSLFQSERRSQRSMSAAGKRTSSATQVALPSFNALMHSNRGQPLSASPGNFKLFNQDTLRLGGDAGDLAHPLGSATLLNSDLGNGVLFSAGTGNGSRSAAGAPAASVGSGTPGTKHSGAAVNLKLSF